jgi:serine protease Do
LPAVRGARVFPVWQTDGSMRSWVAAGTLVLLGCASCVPRAAVVTPPAVVAVAPAQPRPLTPADIAARSLPSVVTMRTSHTLGTGFIVRADGWIATNLHVLTGGPRVVATLRDGRELAVVEVLSASPGHDLALVRVEAHGLPALTLGDSDAMRPGDPIVAIGNPMGLEDTVSNGLVSARRKVTVELEVLQVSAPIAPGSSGGPLFNERGEVIGVATAVVEGGQNLAFGVPVRYLVPMMAKPEPMPFAQFATLLATLREASAPKARRGGPHYPVSLLDACPQEAQKLTVKMLGSAIEAGAPLFNGGKPDACYHVYDGAASDLVRKYGSACRGPAKALGDAQHRAASLNEPSAQAWALRDAFDALLDVIARKQEQ